jgi:hypothetical protein
MFAIKTSLEFDINFVCFISKSFENQNLLNIFPDQIKDSSISQLFLKLNLRDNVESRLNVVFIFLFVHRLFTLLSLSKTISLLNFHQTKISI